MDLAVTIKKIQVKFKQESLPKLLPLSDFVAYQGSYFSRFETCRSGAAFTDLWKEVVKPYLEKVGYFRIQVVKTVLLRHRSDPSLPRRGSHQLHLQLSN